MQDFKEERWNVKERIPSPKAKELFYDIRRKQEISKSDLLASSGLTISTLTRVLDELVSIGVISESGLGASTGDGVRFCTRSGASTAMRLAWMSPASSPASFCSI